MIVGLGIDIASIPRFERALARFGRRFAERILTPAERADLAGRDADFASALAGRFAVKEALAKALGGPKEVTWQHVEVRRRASGAPELVLYGPALALARERGVARQHVSITHDGGIAAAVVVLERLEGTQNGEE